MYWHKDGGYKAIYVTPKRDNAYRVVWELWPCEDRRYKAGFSSGDRTVPSVDVLDWITRKFLLRQWPQCVALPEGI